MIVYRLIGWTASMDWASSSRPVTLGLFMSEESAQAKISVIKSDKEWYMSWDSFDIVSDLVLP